jgi:hypothetical protein
MNLNNSSSFLYADRMKHIKKIYYFHTPDRYAHYAIIEVTKDGYNVSHHQVTFDRKYVIDQLNQLEHPGRAFLIRHMSVQAQ